MIILKHFAVGLVTQVILALIAISTLTPCLQNKTKKSGSFGSILKSEKLKKKMVCYNKSYSGDIIPQAFIRPSGLFDKRRVSFVTFPCPIPK